MTCRQRSGGPSFYRTCKTVIGLDSDLGVSIFPAAATLFWNIVFRAGHGHGLDSQCDWPAALNVGISGGLIY